MYFKDVKLYSKKVKQYNAQVSRNILQTDKARKI